MPVDADELRLETEPMFTDTSCRCPNRANNYHETNCLHSPFYKVPKPSPYAGKRAWKAYRKRTAL